MAEGLSPFDWGEVELRALSSTQLASGEGAGRRALVEWALRGAGSELSGVLQGVGPRR